MDALDVDTHGLVADHTDGSFPTVTQIEVDVLMAYNRGFAVLAPEKNYVYSITL